MCVSGNAKHPVVCDVGNPLSAGQTVGTQNFYRNFVFKHYFRWFYSYASPVYVFAGFNCVCQLLVFLGWFYLATVTNQPSGEGCR